jgi:alkaline phosphatase
MPLLHPAQRLTLAVLLAGCVSLPPAESAAQEPAVRSILLFIADGAGVEYWTAARLHQGRLAVEAMPTVGLVVTGMATADLTDSAAAATALATGTRTFLGAVGVGPACLERLLEDAAAGRELGTCDPLESLFDVAKRTGRATGIVTTAPVVDATPAAFVAKSSGRGYARFGGDIARQLAAFGLDAIAGAGERYFRGGDASDAEDLLDHLCLTHTCITSAADLRSYSGDAPLIALFGDEYMPVAGERSPSLPEMTEAALRRLSRSPGGFVALFESEGSDIAGHANAPLETIVAEMLEFDRAVEIGLDYARRTPGTLVLVTSDHETGGLSLINVGGGLTLANQRDSRLLASYATTRHSAAMVPLFAFGPGAERFAGIRDNEEVGRMLKELIAP